MEPGQAGRYATDAAQFGSAMNSIAHSQAMLAAIRDYKKEVDVNSKASQGQGVAALNVHELLDDAELQKLHEERIAKLRSEQEKRVAMQRKGHGEVQEISEGEFLEVTTKTDMVVCHFFHRDFERCKIMDKHLNILARRHFTTRFIKLSAPDSPFFTVKLNIKMLPCMVFFRKGLVVGQVVGFDGLGGVDDFETSALENAMYQAEVIEEGAQNDEDREEAQETQPSNIRKGICAVERTASDEDSDFD